jgi:hypothetical protein
VGFGKALIFERSCSARHALVVFRPKPERAADDDEGACAGVEECAELNGAWGAASGRFTLKVRCERAVRFEIRRLGGLQHTGGEG